MVSNREAVFRFKIDIQNFEAQVKKMDQLLTRLEQHTDKTTRQMNTFSQSTEKAGTSSAASAVNFQTATQGLLNLSTAAVQTYTSISNLERANNRAKQSVIAVARAEDLLNNKIQRRNEMEEKGIASGGKYANIQREIATAEADLVVKKEKMKIEQAAVNDVYMLFATNVANVVISSTQTIVVLLGQERAARLASALATRVQKVATLDATKATIAQTTATVLQGKAAVAATGATLGFAGSIRVATAAMRTFMSSNPVLLAAMIASTAALLAYETNFLGLKDAIHGTLGVQDDFEESLKSERDAIDDVTGALGDQESQLFKMPNTYSGIINKLKELREHYTGLTTDIESNSKAIITNSTLSQNFSAGGKTALPVSQGQNGIPVDIGIPGIMPSAYGDSATVSSYGSWASSGGIMGRVSTGQFQLNHIASGGQFKLDSPIMGYTQTALGKSIPSGISSKQQIMNILGQMRSEQARIISKEMNIPFEQALDEVDRSEDYMLIAEQILITAATPKAFLEEEQFGKFQRFNPQTYADFKADEDFRKQLDEARNSTKTEIRTKAFQSGLSVEEYTKRASMRQLYQTFGGPLSYRQDTPLKGILEISEIKKLAGIRSIGTEVVFMEKNARLAPSLLRRALQGKRDYGDDAFMNLVQDALNATYDVNMPYGGRTFGKGLILSNNDPRIRDTSGMSPIQKQVFLKTGFDVGRVADSIGEEQAMRIAQLEKGLGYFANTRGGQAYGAAMFLRQEGGRIDIANLAGNTGRGAFAGVSATQAYQVPRGSIAVPSWVKAQIAREDAWRNSVEGQNAMAARALLTGGSFAYSRSVARRGGGLSQDMAFTIRAAGLLGVSVPYEAFNTTANEMFTGAASGLSEIIKANNVRQEFLFAAMNAIFQTSTAAVQRTIPYGFSSVRNSGAAQYHQKQIFNMTAKGLQSYVSRVAQGNFGIYDATVLNAMTGATVSEYTSEVNEFNSKIAPLLNIAHSDFKTTLVDPKRGINEIDDRIRWTQRLEQISTGATVF